MIINKIKEFRKVKNLTQNDLAEYLGVTRKTINQIESGNVLPKIDTAYKLSIILGATVEQLFLNKEYSKHSKKQQEETFEKIANTYFNFKKNGN
ncbi:MAG: helix-turn-helix transcriptional regulator [Candidatus Cloacimonetes bacterium]|nr:helix-turn-helix transcriptional regulator [Candidatus Cloacimonadota bacterium]